MINKENYHLVLNRVESKEANLVAVSKTKPKEAIQVLYDLGQRIFGENKVQEMLDKQEALPKDIKWHMIGTLQRNKVKYIIDFVSLIHSVDRFKLLKEINKQAKKVNRVVDCLLQFHIADEQTKFGLSYEEGVALLESDAYKALENVRIVGLMGMATFTEDKNQVKREFETLYSYFKKFQQDFFADNNSFKEVSMGMSGDYEIALDKGSTLVRVGSLLFGARVYK